MNKTTTKTNKKEEQKKLIVRIICFVLVFALAVTSLLAMFPTLFQSYDGPSAAELQQMIDAGMIYRGEDGAYYYTEEFINSLIVTEPADGAEEADEHAGHDHADHAEETAVEEAAPAEGEIPATEPADEAGQE